MALKTSMIFQQFKQLQVDRMVKALIGMGRDKFDHLAGLFAESYDEIQQERLQKKTLKQLPVGGHPGVFESHEHRLFFLLFYLKTYPTFDVLGFHFGLSAGHAHDAVQVLAPVLQRALERNNHFPKRTLESLDDLKQVVDHYDEIILDGVEIPCVRPQQEPAQTERYSGKKKDTR